MMNIIIITRLIFPTRQSNNQLVNCSYKRQTCMKCVIMFGVKNSKQKHVPVGLLPLKSALVNSECVFASTSSLSF